MKNILIFGSCVSRDVFSNATEKDFHLVDYFARSSFASAFSPQPARAGAWLEAIPSPFQRNMVSRDFEKTFQNTLAGILPETDILLVDLIDERFDLSRFPDGSLCTVSYELKSSGAVLDGNRAIPSMSGEFYALWEQGWRCFVELLQKSGNLGKLRVNKVFWAQNTRTGKDFSPRFSVDHIQRMNIFLQKLYLRMAEDIQADQFFEFPPSLFVGDDFHKWDLNPYHYIPEYYQSVVEYLKTRGPEAGQFVVTSDAQSRRSQASAAPQRKIVITVDVEALRGRADDNHIGRLIWGKQGSGEAEYGIGRMMSIADKYGARLSLFLDYAERWLHGDAFLDVGREIVRRGHDLQLHMHGECFDSNFFASRGLTPQGDIRYWTKECCKHALNYILEAHAEVTAVAPVAYRSGSFYTSIPLTEALAECHIPISANYLPCYNDRHPFLLGLQKYFLWPSGVFELPLSCVENFPGAGYTLHLPAHVAGAPGFAPSRCTPYNFNDPDLLAGSVADCSAKHRLYLDSFYKACGEDAIAVMILHSWSFFDRDQNGRQNLLNEDSLCKFEAVLAELGQDTRFMSMSELALSLPAAPELYSLTHAGIPLVVEEMQITCPICGTPAARFIDFNGGARRMCPACSSLERQRTFKSLYDSGVFGKDCLNAKRILHVSPSGPEAGMLSSIPGAEVVPLKISPGPSQNIVMPDIPDESFDAVFCCFSICLLSKQQLPDAIADIARVLKPGGLLLSCDYYSGGYPKTIQTDGLDAYWKFSVGAQQRHPEEYFSAELSYAVDPATNTELYWLKGVRKEKIEWKLPPAVTEERPVFRYHHAGYNMHNLPPYYKDDEFLEKQNRQNAGRIGKISDLLKNNADISDNYEIFCELNSIMREEEKVFPQYDPRQRVKDSMNLLLTVQNSYGKFDTYLDIGCGMGYAPRAAFEMGCSRSYGVDVAASAQWPEYCRGSDGKLRFLCGDIRNLDFDCKFDLITSYYAFEHFSDPQSILDCIADLLTDRGVFYARFGPVFYGQDGPHLYRQIAIPWFQHIFSERVIRKFLGKPGSNELYQGLNRWSGADFLHLFARQARLKVKSMDFMWNTQNYWFANIFHKYLPYSPQDLYLHGFVLALEKAGSSAAPAVYSPAPPADDKAGCDVTPAIAPLESTDTAFPNKAQKCILACLRPFIRLFAPLEYIIQFDRAPSDFFYGTKYFGHRPLMVLLSCFGPSPEKTSFNLTTVRKFLGKRKTA